MSFVKYSLCCWPSCMRWVIRQHNTSNHWFINYITHENIIFHRLFQFKLTLSHFVYLKNRFISGNSIHAMTVYFDVSIQNLANLLFTTNSVIITLASKQTANSILRLTFQLNSNRTKAWGAPLNIPRIFCNSVTASTIDVSRAQNRWVNSWKM